MDEITKKILLLANEVVKELAIKDKNLALKAVKNSAHILTNQNVKYELEQGLFIKEILFKEKGEGNTSIILDYIFELPLEFEDKYGLNKTWDDLRPTTFEFYRDNRDLVRKVHGEFPLSKYTIKYSFFTNVFGFYELNFRTRTWMTAPMKITNKRVIAPFDKDLMEIPISSIFTIGREIYVGYDSQTIRGIIRSIDYDSGPDETSSVILVGSTKEVHGIIDILQEVREEFRRLTRFEEEVLFHIGQYRKFDYLLQQIKFTKQELLDALARLRSLHYLNDENVITAVGINEFSKIKNRKAGIFN